MVYITFLRPLFYRKKHACSLPRGKIEKTPGLGHVKSGGDFCRGRENA
jgi:hypothetical protein